MVASAGLGQRRVRNVRRRYRNIVGTPVRLYRCVGMRRSAVAMRHVNGRSISDALSVAIMAIAIAAAGGPPTGRGVGRLAGGYDAGIREPGMEKLIHTSLAIADRGLATLRAGSRYLV
jgi:hypothetical protein